MSKNVEVIANERNNLLEQLKKANAAIQHACHALANGPVDGAGEFNRSGEPDELLGCYVKVWTERYKEARERAECAGTWWELVTKLHHLLGIEYHTTTDELVSIVRSRLNCGVESQAEAAAMRDWIQKILRLAQHQKVMGDEEFLEGLKLSQTEGIVCSNKAARAFLDRLRKAEDRAEFAETALKRAVEAIEQTQTPLAEEEELHDWIVRNEDAWRKAIGEQRVLTEKAERERNPYKAKVNNLEHTMDVDAGQLGHTAACVEIAERARDQAEGRLQAEIEVSRRYLGKFAVVDRRAAELDKAYYLSRNRVQFLEDAAQCKVCARSYLISDEYAWEKNLPLGSIADSVCLGCFGKAQVRVKELEANLVGVKEELLHATSEGALCDIYKSFKSALAPFGHEHVNVLARIETLVAEWQRQKQELIASYAVSHDDTIYEGKKTDYWWKRAKALEPKIDRLEEERMLLIEERDAAEAEVARLKHAPSAEKLSPEAPMCTCGDRTVWVLAMRAFYCIGCDKTVEPPDYATKAELRELARACKLWLASDHPWGTPKFACMRETFDILSKLIGETEDDMTPRDNVPPMEGEEASDEADVAMALQKWAGEAQKLESENEELKCKLDEYIEQERARMENEEASDES